MAKLCIFLVLFGIMLTLGDVCNELKHIAQAIEARK